MSSREAREALERHEHETGSRHIEYRNGFVEGYQQGRESLRGEIQATYREHARDLDALAATRERLERVTAILQGPMTTAAWLEMMTIVARTDSSTEHPEEPDKPPAEC